MDELFDFPVPDYNLFGEMRLLSEPDYWQKYPHEISPLLFAILHEAFDFTKWLLKMGSSPDVTDSNRLTPLMYAARVVSFVTNIIKPLFIKINCFCLIMNWSPLWGFLNKEGRKEIFYLMTHSTYFYLWLYGVGHMVKDHSDSERGNPLPPHRLLFSISS